MLHRIPTRFSLINTITYIFLWKMCSKPLKKHSKQKSTKIRQFFNLWGVVVYILWTRHQNCSIIYYRTWKKRKTNWLQHMRSGERKPCTIWNWYVIEVLLQRGPECPFRGAIVKWVTDVARHCSIDSFVDQWKNCINHTVTDRKPVELF